LASLKTQYQDVVLVLKDKISKETDLDEEDRTFEFIKSLENEAVPAIKITEEKINLLSNQYESLIKYFGDTSKDIAFDSFFEIFRAFALDLKVRSDYYIECKY
jgi:hypothetical protein